MLERLFALRAATSVAAMAMLALSLPAAGSATSTWASLSASNFFADDVYDEVGYGVSLISSVHGSTNAADLNGEFPFSGLNSAAAPQTMTVSASAAATATLGQLGMSTRLSIKTPYYNAGNPAFVNEDGVHAGGSPDVLGIFGYAEFKDDVVINSALPITTLRVSVSLKGSITYSDSFGGATQPSGVVYSGINISSFGLDGNSCIDCGFVMVNGPGVFDQIHSFDVPVSASSTAILGFDFATLTSFDLRRSYDELADYTVAADFSRGVQIVSIQGLDSAGQLVALNSVIGSDGTAYQISAVPEVSEAALFASGLLALACMKRRRSGPALKAD